MFLIILIAAFAIDLAQWYQRHHQAQVSADAAALAAANCLAHGVCTNTSSTGDAAATATTLANNNQVPVSGSVNISNNQVTVTTASAAPVEFGSVFGFNPTASARAVAAWKTSYTADASVFAQDCASPIVTPITTPCTVNCSTYGVDVETSGNTNISGAIVSNGSMKINSNPNTKLEVVNYGDAAGTNCSSSNDFTHNKASITAGPPGLEPQFEYFPDTYQNDYENDCVSQATLISTYQASTTNSGAPIYLSGNTVTINGPLGTSSSPLHIEICALGDSQSLSGYTTINVAPNASLYGVSLLAKNITFAAKTGNNSNNVTIVGDSNITPDNGNTTPQLAMYTTATTFTMGTAGCQNGNNLSVTGAVFAPLATPMTVCGNNGQALLEANTILMQGNNTGSGTPVTLSLLNPIDYLAQ